MAKEEKKKAETLEDVEVEIEAPEAATPSKDAETLGQRKSAKAKKPAPEPEADSLEGSTSLYWHSFLLVGGRLLNRMLDWYNGLFSFTPKDKAKLYRNISQHYLKRGSYDKAMKYLKEWARNEKSDPEPIYQMALALASMGEYQRAVNAFDKVLKLRPTHMVAMYRKSALLVKMKDYAGAIKGLEQISAENPNDPKVFYLLGLAYDGAGQLEQGIAAMQKAVDLDPDEIKYHQHLGFMNVRREDHKTAAEHFTKVMELERDQEGDEE